LALGSKSLEKLVTRLGEPLEALVVNLESDADPFVVSLRLLWSAIR
jgi:hypothetical protein